MQMPRSIKGCTPVLVFALATALTACGGGGGGSGAAAPAVAAAPATAAAVPVQASASVSGLIAWAGNLPRSETAEPLDTDAFHPPVDDGAQPVAITVN